MTEQRRAPIAHAEDAIRFLELLARPGDVFEMRGLSKRNGKQMVTAGFFDDMALLARAAVDRSGRDDGIYVTINPVHRGLLSRLAKNRVHQAGNGDTSSDKDIPQRRHLLIDVDPVRPAGISSTDEEHAAAIALVTGIAAELATLGWPAPLVADSGNGGHLIYAIDLPREDGHLVARVLAQLSKRFSTPALKVDEKVFNPARISKIYGTLTRKGESTEERPHRVSRIVSAPAAMTIVTREQLEEFAPAAAPTPQPSRSVGNPDRHSASPDRYAPRDGRPAFDLEAFIAEHLPDAQLQDWSGGEHGSRKWLLPTCPFNSGHDRREAFIVEMNSGAVSAGCKHDSCVWGWQELRRLFDPTAYDRTASPSPPSASSGRPERTATARLTDREPPPEVVYEDTTISPGEAAEIDALYLRERETDAPPVKPEVRAEIRRAPQPAPAKLLGRTWEHCLDEVYARKDEEWIDIRIGTTTIATCRDGSFVPLVAPSGAGKSTLVLQMLVDHARHRGPAIYLTYELDGDEAVARAVGQLCSYSWAGVLRGQVPRATIPAVDRIRILERDEATLGNLEKLVAEFRRSHLKQPILVVVDYMQASPAPPGKERGHVANVSADLRRAAKKNRVVLIGVSQASTDNSKKMRAGELLGIESSATGAETAQIERDAYVILTLGDRRVVDRDTVAWKLSTAKYRLGEADFVHELHFRGRIGTWEVVGDPVTATVAREAKATEGKSKKVEELKRSIVALVEASPRPMSKAAIAEASTGGNSLISEVIKTLLRDGALIHMHGLRKGGAPLIWTPENAQKESTS